MSATYTPDPAIKAAVSAIVSMCERHTVDGIAVINPDCGDCGSRQEATRIYLLGIIEDARKAFGL